MNEKINIQDLSSILVSQNTLTKEEADNFIREFFALIVSALDRDKYVKIKGLGVFKLIEVEARESMNINTKERFEIPGYTKVSFTPDASLRDTINKPFAHFETVILNENTVFEDANTVFSDTNTVVSDTNTVVSDTDTVVSDTDTVTEDQKEEKPMPDEEKSMEEPAPEILPEPVFEETASSARKSAMKIYIVLIVLLLTLLGCMFFFVNRTRMAKEERMQNLDEKIIEPQVLEDTSLCVQDDSIHLISSQTSVR